MTAAEEREFIALWAQGLSQDAIARQLGIPVGTVKSRAHTLAHAGKLTPRPRGGASPRQQGKAAMVPVQRPVQTFDTGAVSSADTGAGQTLDTAAVQRIDRLESEVEGLRLLMQGVMDRLEQPAVQTPVQISTLPPYPKAEAVRWNLWINRTIRDELATLAAKRDISPSQLVQELLWKALNDR